MDKTKEMNKFNEVAIAYTTYEQYERFWMETFAGELVKSSIPYDNQTHTVTNDLHYVEFTISGDQFTKLEKLSNNSDYILHMALLASLTVVVNKYTNNRDIIIGSPIYRQKVDTDFINSVLALRMILGDTQTFKELLLQVRQTMHDVTKNQNYPLEVLSYKLGLPCSETEFGLFDLGLMLENIHDRRYWKGLPLSMIFVFERDQHELKGRLEYNPFRYEKGTAKRIVQHFIYILELGMSNLDLRITDLEVLTDFEREQILHGFNQTKREYATQRSISEEFERQVEKTPDKVAVIFEDQQVSYQQLNERANRLAWHMRGKGVNGDSIVGMMLEPSLQMAVGLLAILKAGGAYLPIDPTFPSERIKYMLKDSEVQLLLTEKSWNEDGALDSVERIWCNDPWIEESESGNLPEKPATENLAYVIYTSGSTGNPKGVMIEHRNILNTIYWRKEAYGLDETDHVLQVQSFSVDGFVPNFFTPLCVGADVVLLSRDDMKDVIAIRKAIAQHKITNFTCVPSLCLHLMEDFSSEEAVSIQSISLGGEEVKPRLVQLGKQCNPKIQFVNEYGPTENSVVTTALMDIELGSKMTIGTPLPNTRVYILDSHLHMVPIGVAGELCVSGAGVARGYLNRVELTAQKFVANSFEPGVKMYRTGDLARWLANGEIEFLGRIDNQVKIRGYRIETGEIENAIMEYTGVKEVLVTAKEDQTEGNYLCAYLTLDGHLDEEDLHQFLAARLPEYMIPMFVQLTEMPLTPGGKIDQRALPAPKIKEASKYIAPRDEVETRLAKIWADILGMDVQSISIDSNFFRLGGHSLKATMLNSRIHKEFEVRVPLSVIFKAPTIREVANYLQNQVKHEMTESFVPIKVAEHKEVYPLSSAQKRMYFLNQLSGTGISYNLPMTVVLEGTLERVKVEEIFSKLIQRHESLRTSFVLQEGTPVQKIHEEIDFALAYDEVAESQVEGLIKSFIQPFNLSQAPLLRAVLLRIQDNRHFLFVDMHHIISDGVSSQILMKEFISFYQEQELPALKIQYKDYAEWQNSHEGVEGLKDQERYWLGRFADEIPVLNLLTDYPRPSMQSFAGDSLSFRIEPRESKILKEMALEEGTTLFTLLLAAFDLFLFKLTGQNDLVVGTPIAGRRHVELQPVIGMFVNTLALRNFPRGDMSFKEFLQEVKQSVLEAFEYQDYPFEILVEKLAIERDFTRNPLFDTLFSFDTFGQMEMTIPGLTIKPYNQTLDVAKFDLSLLGTEHEECLYFTLTYCTKLFQRDTMERFVGYLKQIMTSIAENRNQSLADMKMISSNEMEQLISGFNNFHLDYANDKTINALFDEQVRKHPNVIAVVYHDQSLTYQQLSNQVNYLSRMLRRKGVGPDEIVGLVVEPSLETIVGIMAILKSGGAYLPIDPVYPIERQEFMLEDSGARVILTQRKFDNLFQKLAGTPMILLDEVQVGEAPIEVMEDINTPENLAYVIYTSGTTGQPKGTLNEHRNVVNLLAGWREQVFKRYEENLRIALGSSYIFDASVLIIFAALLQGHTLHMASEEIRLDPEKLMNFYVNAGIEFTFLTPHHLQILLEYTGEKWSDLKMKGFIVGGEVLPKHLVEQLFHRFSTNTPEIYNIYGPTQCCVNSMIHTVTKENIHDYPTIPIGKPMPNQQIYIVNETMDVQPIGVAGEIYIGGDGVARGYLHRETLTAEKYVSNPFREEILYKTGDLARWMPDGNILFIGRMDQQIKIRGYRIEVEEIEARIRAMEMIREAIVIDWDSPTREKALCAYVIAEEVIDPAELKEALRKHLPDYMIPVSIIQVDQIPLSPNGKINRKALPLPWMQSVGDYVAPNSDLESKLVQIWTEVLGLQPNCLGVTANFFELGGHSLKAVQLCSKIHQHLDVTLQLTDLFRHSTVRSLANFIAGEAKNLYISIPKAGKKEYYPLSSAQKRLYVLQQMNLENINYNTPLVLMLEGELQYEQLEQSFNALIQRHESLRHSFSLHESEIMQKIHDHVEFTVQYVEADAETQDLYIKKFLKPFDLSQAPLMRVGLIKVASSRHLLVLDLHHIITDGTSQGIFIRDFMAIYQGESLPPLAIQYKDFAEWQNLRQHTEGKKQEAYWLGEFTGDIPVLNLPTDYSRPLIQSFEGNVVNYEMSEEETRGLKALMIREEATLFMVLLSIYTIFLAKLSGQDDIIIGTPVAGRRHAELEPIIGMFINTLALRNTLTGQKTFTEFLGEVKVRSLEAFEHQDYPFEELVEKVASNRNLSRNPLFDVMFILQNLALPEVEMPGLRLKPYDYQLSTAKFDLNLVGFEQQGKITFALEYSNKLFKEDTIGRFITYFKQIVTGVLQNPEQTLEEIEMIPAEEKEQLLYHFNSQLLRYPADIPLDTLFAQQVKQIPDNVALVAGEERLIYKELAERVDRRAFQLRQKGVKTNDIIGLMVEPSLEMIVGIMAILKAGGAYLPIEPSDPVQRQKYMLDDSGARLLLTQRVAYAAKEDQLKECALDEVIFLDDDLTAVTGSVEEWNTSHSLAYVLYTSGTTGQPKGVMIRHQSVSNLVAGAMETLYYEYEDSLHFALLPSYTFDISVLMIFGALLKGHTLYTIAEEIKSDPDRLLNFFVHEEIHTTILTPTHLRFMLEHKGEQWSHLQLKCLLVIGEVLHKHLVERVFDQCGTHVPRLYNTYGPTETCVLSSVYEVTRENLNDYKTIPIGKPMPNEQIYIVNHSNALQPMGVIGELLIGGDGVADGYFGREELTVEKFIPNPFGLQGRLYRTGDLAYWNADGHIEFMGRKDHQVKIRGYRIELGEIEKQLQKIPGVHESLVIDWENAEGEKELCAYLRSDEEINPVEIKNRIAEHLPEYMVPSFVIQLDRIPLTTSGKVDRQALPQPRVRSEGIYAPPANMLEESLVEIWSELLSVDKHQLSVQANFFTMGGHSLKAVQVISKIHKRLNVKITLTDFFRNPIIRSLAQFIMGEKKEEYVSIPKAAKKEYYPLSSAQKRLYVLQQMNLESTNYNIPLVLVLEGELQYDRIEQSFKSLIQRHESLRTSFILHESEVVQQIHDHVEFSLQYVEVDAETQDLYIKEFLKPFDLSQAPLLRVGLIKVASSRHLLVLDLHHIITDGTSQGVFIHDFIATYQGVSLPPLAIQYKDFAEWQNVRQLTEGKEQEAYWLREFSGEIPVLNLPTDYSRPTIQSFEGSVVNFEMSEEETQGLKALAIREEATLFMILLSVYTLLLAKLSGQDDIVVGTPVAGRRHAELEQMIGMFINTLALRNTPTGKKTFREFLQAVKVRTLEAFEHQDYPFEELVEKVASNRDLSRNPLFDVMFVLQNLSFPEVAMPGLRLKQYDYQLATAKFDFNLVGFEQQGKLYFALEYSTKLFKEDTIVRYISYFKQIVTGVLQNPEQTLEKVEMIPVVEKDRLLYHFNPQPLAYSHDMTLDVLFARQVKQTPNNVALVAVDEQLTYKELAEKVERWAIYLQQKGVKANEIVGLMVEPSVEMIVGIMAILQAGGAYLPIEPTYPTQRQKFMLEDSGARLLLTQKEIYTAKEVQWMEFDLDEVIILDGDLPEGSGTVEDRNTPHNLAYVLYTSGTTGQPKGVMIRHQSVNNLVSGAMETLYHEYENNLHFALLSSYTFDISVLMIFTALLRGNSLYMISEEIKLEPGKLLDFFVQAEIHTTILTPTHLQLLLEHKGEQWSNLTMKCLLIAGEVLSKHLIERVLEQWGTNVPQLYNAYGPTETCVISSKYHVTRENLNDYKIIPIGKPMPNEQMYIVNQNNALQPIGVVGELLIGGDGVASGYLGREELTAEKFIPNPFGPKGQLYRTGDLAYWTSDGNIIFLGRKDHQVKIRGYRIELAEIEQQLREMPGIHESLIVYWENTEGEKELCAYYRSDEELDPVEIKNHLVEQLPEYMIPAFFIRLERIPLTTSGKVDRQALPRPEVYCEGNYVPPVSPLEENLAEIWSELLSVEKQQLSVYANFFQLGGHSLKAVQFITKIHKKLGVRLALTDLFKYPTIRSLAQFIVGEATEEYISIPKAASKEFYQLSSAQRRLFVLQQKHPESTNYNVPIILMLEGELHREKFVWIFQEMIRRHESLRTSFITVNGEVMQKVHDAATLEIPYVVVTEDLVNEHIQEFLQPFDLGQAPLMRVDLIQVGESTHILCIDMHHIITDGFSQTIFIKEFMALYQGHPLPPMRIQYKDFAEWQNSLKLTEKQEEYWLNKFSGEIPVLHLPTDFARPAVWSSEGSAIQFELDEMETEGLNELAYTEGATLFILLLTIYNIFLAKVSGQDDLVVGTPVAGRRHADVEQIIGMFVNTLALRNTPKGSKTVREFLLEVKEQTLEAFENQDYQFEDLVEKIEWNPDLSRNPLFDVMFVLQNTSLPDMDITELRSSQYDYQLPNTKFDLNLSGFELRGRMNFNLQYSTRLFTENTILRFIAYFKKIVVEVLANADQKLEELEIIPVSERRRLLEEFNHRKGDYPSRTLNDLFAERVELCGEDVAVVAENGQLTYDQLHGAASRVAYWLRQQGLKANEIVGLMVGRSVEMIIGIQAILKAGGAYLPLDPTTPLERQKFMLGDSQVRLVLTQKEMYRHREAYFREFALDNILCIDSNLPEVQELVEDINSPEDLAYVIYTSGTTGQPKGVMIRHRNVNYLVQGLYEQIYRQYDYRLRISLVAPYVFDASVKQIFAAQLLGHSLYIVPEEGRFNATKLIEFYHAHGIDVSDGTPTHIRLLTEALDSQSIHLPVKQFIIGGEALHKQVVERFLQAFQGNPPEIINVYGPTECTVDATIYEISQNNLSAYEMIPIGKPMPNAEIYILDQNQRLQPIGVAGELCIGGAGVGKGYICRDELTAARFIENPFKPGEIIYKTGDIVRWLADGNIEFFGRSDHQVKIHGFRIELADIESHLLGMDVISHVTVTDYEGPDGEKELCAYFVTNTSVKTEVIREMLQAQLPGYMIPTYWIPLEQLPVTRNGKVDRKALPKPVPQSEKTYVAPRNDREERLATIWQRIFFIEQVGIDDDFFELGGTSIRVLRFISDVYKEFGIKFQLAEIYRKPTIRAIAELLLQSIPSEETHVISWNRTKKRAIFCFPDLFGQGIIFRPVASLLEEYSIHAFNYITDSDKVNRYAQWIMELQPKGEITLLGYSAGGNLAYEVAKELEQQGRQVVQLILLDSYVNQGKIQNLSEGIQEVETNIVERTKYYQIDEIYKAKMMEGVRDFLTYNAHLENTGFIQAEIHCIYAFSVNGFRPDLWDQLTRESFTMHQGYGTHYEMMATGFVEKNIEIISQILTKI